jgi:hypothetical protein
MERAKPACLWQVKPAGKTAQSVSKALVVQPSQSLLFNTFGVGYTCGRKSLPSYSTLID